MRNHDNLFEKQTEDTHESVTKFFDKNSSNKTPKFVNSLIQENQSLRIRILELENE
jgi:hypothetical protein